MLVLTRRPGEMIRIDTGAEIIEIFFVEWKPNRKARLGIEAPDHVSIARGELVPLKRLPKRRCDAPAPVDTAGDSDSEGGDCD